MKKSFTALLAVTALGLAACGGVDRDGSRDLFIEQIKDATGLEADADCVEAAMDSYSDDELKDFDKAENQDSPEFTEFRSKLIECVDFGG